MAEDDPERGQLHKKRDDVDGTLTDHGDVTRAQAGMEIGVVEEMIDQVGGDPNMKGWLAHRCYVSGDLERAEALYRELIASDHDPKEQWLQLGAVLLKKGVPEEAVAAWETVIRLAPESRQATKAQARIVKLRSDQRPPG